MRTYVRRYLSTSREATQQSKKAESKNKKKIVTITRLTTTPNTTQRSVKWRHQNWLQTATPTSNTKSTPTNMARQRQLNTHFHWCQTSTPLLPTRYANANKTPISNLCQNTNTTNNAHQRQSTTIKINHYTTQSNVMCSTNH